MSLTSLTCFHYISGIADGKENTGFFSPSESCKTADLELWSVDDYLAPGILFPGWFEAGGGTDLAHSLVYPLCIIVGHCDQMIRLNMVKLQGGHQNGSLEKNFFSHQVSLVLQVKANCHGFSSVSNRAPHSCSLPPLSPATVG